jgi:multicomponent Na+:H+ antiporter subunit B
MSPRTRLVVALPALGGFAALLAWSLAGIHAFGDFDGRYGTHLDHIAVPQRHISNAVAATVFDYRGFDTLGEELILMTATIGITMLLRSSGEEGGEQKQFRDRVRLDGISVPGVLALGCALLVGLWLAAFGYVTPGGGFQGGVVVAGALLLVYLAHSHRAFRRLSNEEILDPIEGLGGGGYIVIGLAALVSGAPFLHNLLGHGSAGTLWSGGSVPLLNWATAFEVAAANVILMSEFLDEYLVPLGPER